MSNQLIAALRRCALPVLAGWTLAGCALAPPRPAPPTLPATAPLPAAPPPSIAETASAPPAVSAGWPQRDWWRGFGDATLDTLVDQALAQSPDLAAAEARLAAARAAIDTAAAGFRLRSSADGSVTRQRLSDNGLFPPELLGFSWYNQFDAGINASYNLGRRPGDRPLTRAAVASAQAAAAEREAAALAISSSVAETYYALQGNRARQALAAQRLTNATRQAQIVDARAAASIQRDDDRQRAALELLAARDQQSELAIAAELQQVALAALLALAPSELPAIDTQALPELRTALPDSASLDLIARRADIAAARWRVEAAARQRDVARGDFYPDVTLKALLGLSSRELGVLLQAGSGVPSAALAVHLPLFDGGSLRAGYARSQAQLAGAVAAYRAAIVNAAHEVNDRLATRDHLLRQAALRSEQLGAAAALRDSAARRAAAGITDAQPALDAESLWLAQCDATVQTQLAGLNAELALIRALGGGFRMDTQP